MTIEKLPSGSYRIRQMKDGIRQSITVPYKPTKKEAYELLEAQRSGRPQNRQTFGECAKEYVKGKKSVLSPSTVRGYESIMRMIPTSISNKPINELTSWNIQTYVDSLAKDDKSPKTIANYYGFILAVFGTFCPETNISVTLPQKRRKTKYLPTDEDVKKILAQAKGTRYEIPLRLACYGLRRSEICALTAHDLDGNRLTINKAKVKDGSGNWVIKTTKTVNSNRTITIDNNLADMIRSTGTVFSADPNKLYVFLQKAQTRLEIEHFPLHYLRHYYASTMHELGVPDAVILEAGGWKTDNVMKSVYRHAKDVDDKQRIMVSHMDKLMDNSGQKKTNSA